MLEQLSAQIDDMARVLGYSREQVLRDCTIRELLLFIGTRLAVQPAKPPASDYDARVRSDFG